MPNSLDPKLVNLTKSIALAESGGGGMAPNYNAIGDAGTSHGAYQWQPGNFEAAAKKAGLDPSDFSPKNQNLVAYAQVKDMFDRGFSPEEIAASWNAGEGKAKNGAWKTNVGTTTINGQQIAYDTPSYVKRVSDYYKKLYSQSPTQDKKTNTEVPLQKEQTSLLPNPSSIGHELTNNLNQRGHEIANAVSTATHGGLTGIPSGILQGVGAVAGAVGDTANAALELVPGVQALEEGLGAIVKGAANTSIGQKAIEGISHISQKYPEFAADVGAAINILSVLPIFRGLSIAKGVVSDAVTNTLKSKLESKVSTEIRNAVGSRVSQSISSAERRGLDPIKLISSDGRNLPSIVERPTGGFEYNSSLGIKNIQGNLSKNEDILQNMLSQGIKKNVGVDLNNARQQMIGDILNEFPVSARGGQAVRAINEFFDNVLPTTRGRNVITINELNGLKRDIGGGVNWLNLGVKNNEIKSAMYRSLMNQVVDYASKAGVNGVEGINKIMGEQIEALKILGDLNGSTVFKTSKDRLIRELAADFAGVGGELAGSGMGIPFAATLAGRGVSRLIPGRVPSAAMRMLGQASRRTSETSLKKGLLKIGGGLGLQGLVQLPQQVQ